MAKIIVIGAGIAGLKAALDLAQRDHQVTLLEARPRLGGRIYTTTGADRITPVELGASFWEGKADNPFYQQYFAQSSSTTHQPYTQVLSLNKSTLFSVDLFQANSQKQDLSLIAKAYHQAQERLLRLTPQATGQSCKAFITGLFPEKADPSALDYWIQKWMEHDLRHHCTPLSQRGFGSFHIPPDIEHLESWNDAQASFCFVGGGYHRIIDQITLECEKAGVHILLNQQVTHVHDQAQQGVQVKATRDQFQADKVISTIPVGVLKKVAADLFTPALSAEKLRAIQALGVHEATRIILEFAHPFWPVDSPYLFLDFPDQEGFKEFRNNFPLHGKALLQTDSYADVAQWLLGKRKEQHAHKLLIDGIMRDLRKVFPRASDPIYYLIHHWTNDPFAQGAYPYRTVEMTEQAQQALERSEGNIYFAGADISRHGFSVHNAYASGKRTAQMI